jgi:hypothetical protein
METQHLALANLPSTIPVDNHDKQAAVAAVACVNRMNLVDKPTPQDNGEDKQSTVLAATCVNRMSLPQPIPPETYVQIHQFAKPSPTPEDTQINANERWAHPVPAQHDCLFFTQIIKGERLSRCRGTILCCCPWFRYRWVQDFFVNSNRYPLLLLWTGSLTCLAVAELSVGFTLLFVLGNSVSLWLTGIVLFFGAWNLVCCPCITWCIADEDHEDNDAFSVIPPWGKKCFFVCYGLTNGPIALALMCFLCQNSRPLPCDTSSV